MVRGAYASRGRDGALGLFMRQLAMNALVDNEPFWEYNAAT